MALHTRTVRLLVLALGGSVPGLLLAQTNISGLVRDSLSGKPLGGATVQLVPSATPWLAGRTVRSDSLGRFSIDTVAPGQYLFGFQHPRLDSLGMEAVTRTLDVFGSVKILRADLALPSGRTFVRSFCGANSDSSGAVIGRVFNADDGAAAHGGSVIVRWAQMRIDNGGVRRVQMRTSATFGADGRYVACDVPTDVPILLQARAGVGDSSRANDMSGEIELAFTPNVPLLHRDLYLAAPEQRSVTSPGVAAASSAPGTARAPTAPAGTARLTGRVAGADGRPVAGARVSVRGTDVVVSTDSAGMFRATGLPAGTRAVDVTALGYAPVRTAADLRPNRETSIAVSTGAKIATVSSVNVVGATPDRGGFLQRRAAGVGYFLDANTIEQRGAQNVAQALLNAPTLRANGYDSQNRPLISGRNYCKPSAFLDGQLLRDGVGGVDDLLTVRRVGGIEVYPSAVEAPAQFRGANGSCAVILVWTRAYVP